MIIYNVRTHMLHFVIIGGQLDPIVTSLPQKEKCHIITIFINKSTISLDLFFQVKCMRSRKIHNSISDSHLANNLCLFSSPYSVEPNLSSSSIRLCSILTNSSLRSHSSTSDVIQLSTSFHCLYLCRYFLFFSFTTNSSLMT